MASGGNGGDPSWAWLGLLKWSLAYSDGTKPSSESMKPMSAEDKEFLETVMKEGIINEGERMKKILTDLAGALERRKADAEGGDGNAEEKVMVLTENDMVELLLELRDIVEQIDYARAFSAMGGVPFLVGCASERSAVPRSIRTSCLGVLATLAQNNPQVQDVILKNGSLQTLADLFFAEIPAAENADGEPDINGQTRSRIVQAMSSTVRGHQEGERAFCASEGGRQVIECGLGVTDGEGAIPPPPAALRKRCLFFLQALVTSDGATVERVRLFEPCIRHVCENFLVPDSEPDTEIREMALDLLGRMMTQNKNVDAIVEKKDNIVGQGVQRVSVIRKMDGDDREFSSHELELWEKLIVQLARANPSCTATDGVKGC